MNCESPSCLERGFVRFGVVAVLPEDSARSQKERRFWMDFNLHLPDAFELRGKAVLYVDTHSSPSSRSFSSGVRVWAISLWLNAPWQSLPAVTINPRSVQISRQRRVTPGLWRG